MKAVDYEKHELNVVQVSLRALVLAASDKSAGLLDDMLSGVASLRYRVSSYAGESALKKAAIEPRPDLVILELENCSDKTLQDIRQFVEKYGDKTELFVALWKADMQVVKNLVQSGVRDILTLPLGEQDLAIALSASQARLASTEKKQSEASRGTVTAFMSTHANAGASTIAVNFAYQLAAVHKKNTVLVDMDIQFGTVASELDIKSDGNLLEALRNPDRIDSVFLDALITRHASGLNVLSSPGDLSASEYLRPQAISRLISVLEQDYDHVVINPPLYVNDAVEQMLRLSNPVFLVTQDSLYTLRNLKMIMQRLPLRGVPVSHIEVIHNLPEKGVQVIKSNDLKKLIGSCPLYSVRTNHKFSAMADNAGKVVSDMYHKTRLSRDIGAIASNIASEEAGAVSMQKKGFWGRFL